MKKLYLIICLLIVSSVNYGQTRDEKSLDSLITAWQHRDGAQFIELSYSISKMFIQNDTLFYRVMKKNVEAFNSWLVGLQNSVFLIREYNDNVDKELQNAYYSKLLNMMKAKTRLLPGNYQYAALAKKIKYKLKDIKIMFVD